MQAAGAYRVQLKGGPLDGDTFIMSPQGSQTAPGTLMYIGTTANEACWLMYVFGILGMDVQWPACADGAEPETHAVDYNFAGRYSIDLSRRL